MKLQSVTWSVAVALATLLAACSDDGITTDPDPTPGTDPAEAHYMYVTISNPPELGSRAEGDQQTTGEPTTDNAKYEQGTADEYAISSLRFYFFDAQGQPFELGTGSNKVNYYDPNEVTSNQADMPNVDMKYNALIVLKSSDQPITDVKYMVAVANHKLIDGTSPLGNQSKTLKELRADCNQITLAQAKGSMTVNGTASDRFLMTSSVWGAYDSNTGVSTDKENNPPYADQLQNTCEVDISQYIRPTQQDAENNPVDVYVERVVAKVRMTDAIPADKAQVEENQAAAAADATETTPKCHPVYKTNSDGTISTTQYTITDDTNTQRSVVVQFTSWGISGDVQYTNLFKVFSQDWGASNAWGFTTYWGPYHRSYWALNPENVGNRSYLSYEEQKDASNVVTQAGITNQFYTTGSTTPAYYCLENAGDKSEDGTKTLTGNVTIADGSSSTKTISDASLCTEVIVAAKLGYLDDSNAFKELSLAEWAGTISTEDATLKSMMNSLTSQIYIDGSWSESSSSNEASTTPTTFKSIPEAQITKWFEFVAAEKAQGVTAADLSTKQDGKRYLSYINKKSSGSNMPDFYYRDGNNSDGTPKFSKYDGTESGAKKLNDVLTSIGGAKVWNDGMTYYYTRIKHLGTSTQTGDEGKAVYGVVRNHIYDIAIQSVSGLGTPVYDPTLVIIPQKPKDDESFIGAVMKVLSWRVVSQGASFAW